jgi:hypothetical protein
MIEFVNPNIKTCIAKKDGVEFINIEMNGSSVTNKFTIVQSFITRLSDFFCEDNEFDDWLEYFLISCQHHEEHRYEIITENIPVIKKFVDEYYEHAGIDYSLFVDETKSKKSSILFSQLEIKEIVKHSGYLKVYALISNSKDYKLDDRLHRVVYNLFLDDINKGEITAKVFNIVKTKTYRYSFSDKYMWEYISAIQCKGIDLHIIQIFNFIMNSIIILCEEGRNPIIFFTTVVDESIKWLLRSVYKTTVIYEDAVATESIQSMNIDNLKTYSYNDTIGRLKGIAYENLYKKIEEASSLSIIKDSEKDMQIVTFQNRMKEIVHISPIVEHFMYPLLSKATNIPYRHFKTLSPEYSTIISYLMKGIFQSVFKNDYRHIISLMEYYPVNQPPLMTTYKVKEIHNCVNFQNQVNDFYGFSTKIISTKIMSHLIGRVSRITFKNTYSGEKISGSSMGKIESDLIKFYTLYWANQMGDEIAQINKSINHLF